MTTKEHHQKQIEWQKKLQSLFECVETKLEYFIKYGSWEQFRIDVYGKDKDGNEYFVEIGVVNNKEKLRFLREQKRATFIYVPYTQKNGHRHFGNSANSAISFESQSC